MAGIEIGWGELIVVVTGLTGVIGTLSMWLKKMLQDAVKSMETELKKCEDKHFESAIKVARLEEKVSMMKDFDVVQKNILTGQKNLLEAVLKAIPSKEDGDASR